MQEDKLKTVYKQLQNDYSKIWKQNKELIKQREDILAENMRLRTTVNVLYSLN